MTDTDPAARDAADAALGIDPDFSAQLRRVKIVDLECHCPRCGEDFIEDVILSADYATLQDDNAALRATTARLVALNTVLWAGLDRMWVWGGLIDPTVPPLRQQIAAALWQVAGHAPTEDDLHRAVAALAGEGAGDGP